MRGLQLISVDESKSWIHEKRLRWCERDISGGPFRRHDASTSRPIHSAARIRSNKLNPIQSLGIDSGGCGFHETVIYVCRSTCGLRIPANSLSARRNPKVSISSIKTQFRESELPCERLVSIIWIRNFRRRRCRSWLRPIRFALPSDEGRTKSIATLQLVRIARGLRTCDDH